MDSGMLNVFHEDPFEGNFAKYETEPNFWTANDDELQLTDTLNGILPIAPTDVSLLSSHHGEEDDDDDDDGDGDGEDHGGNRKNLLIFSDYMDQESAYEQHRQLSALVEYERKAMGNDDDDAQSQCSNSTFRTRTDSSSIGDYESHTSDYDDDENDAPDHNDPDPDGQRKNRTLSTNTIASETDAFGLNIDVNNFDLAEFITKDDFAENLNTIRLKEKKSQTPEASPCAAPKPGAVEITANALIPAVAAAIDDDTDSIIDVETVDVIDVDESVWRAKNQTAGPDDLRYVDNVKSDPSWSPKSSASKKTIASGVHKEPKLMQDSQQKPVAAAVITTAKPKSSNNICLVPSKKQCDFLKRKVNGGRSTKLMATAKKGPEAQKSGISKQPNNTLSAAPCSSSLTGLGLGGKNLALLKHEQEAAAAEAVAEQLPKVAPPKRKLNLEEYKQRRSGGVLAAKPKAAPTATSSPTPAKQARIENTATTTAVAKQLVQPLVQPSPQKLAIASIVNSLKCPDKVPVSNVPMDPITIAKNKVLRMLEMKRAQQLKIIDSRVNAKVPRVTKLPPLKDIVKDTYCMVQEQEEGDETVAETKLDTSISSKPNNSLHPDYEEIIIVSVGCNTEITIPPNQMSRTSPRSLLKSSVLLYNISNSQDANKNINSSLIASIQSEVVKQTSCTTLKKPTAPCEPAGESESRQHGEDMVIMHLPKDRVRKPLSSMSTQTDLQPEFPVLTTVYTKRQSRQRLRKNRNYRQVVSQSGSEGSSSSRGSSSSSSSSLESYRSRSRSRSNSLEQLRHLDSLAPNSSIAHGGYSSRSTHRHRSSVSSSSYSEAGKYERRQRRTSYNKRRLKNPNARTSNFSSSGSDVSDRERSRSPIRSCSRARSNNNNNNTSNNNNRRAFVDRNVSQPAVEERRIVYVGRIETETTKEMLRRKFLPYGSIKQITIHYKENGMKYGFVTYERAQDAFTAIDTSARDPQINMYDISFGGRRAFCRASYADLDNAGMDTYHSYVYPKSAPAPKPQEDSFEALLLKVKAKLNAGKPDAAQPEQSGTTATTPSIPPDHNNQI
ncbi:uncharacterized protein LOC6650112 isoform X2 [Drosophila willistoni]|uniref:uncharacterized protein LOC6650112 isoform X2 n=1 Tax=Drosophila willistoni TaxID=7260 RepID=UPI000C26C36A|nr:uncharacterized protein LOC6650112 isoform X2 [Drosophila willistoni]